MIWNSYDLLPPCSRNKTKHLSTLKKLSLLDSLVPFDLIMIKGTLLLLLPTCFIYTEKYGKPNNGFISAL